MLIDAFATIVRRVPPHPSVLGIAVAILSLIAMPILARAKRRIAVGLSSSALTSAAAQSSLCAYLSAILLGGLALNALVGWWWAVDYLLAQGAAHVTVLDVSAVAIARAQARLGARASAVTWIEADVTQAALPARRFDVWHDRAVFHFLTDAQDQKRYVDVARRALKRGGHLIVATFATDAPSCCSGLDVVRYSPDALRGAFFDGFDVVTHGGSVHQTPAGIQQQFSYCCLRRQ